METLRRRRQPIVTELTKIALRPHRIVSIQEDSSEAVEMKQTNGGATP